MFNVYKINNVHTIYMEIKCFRHASANNLFIFNITSICPGAKMNLL